MITYTVAVKNDNGETIKGYTVEQKDLLHFLYWQITCVCTPEQINSGCIHFDLVPKYSNDK